MNTGLDEIDTGVPQITEQLRKLRVDPGDESIRRVINSFEDDPDWEYALLVSKHEKFMRTADLKGHSYIMTTRPFLQELERRGKVDDAEALMQKAEAAAIHAGETLGRGQLNRSREWNTSPVSNVLIRPF